MICHFLNAYPSIIVRKIGIVAFRQNIKLLIKQNSNLCSFFMTACSRKPAAHRLQKRGISRPMYTTMSLRFFPVHISDCVPDQPADRSFFHFYFTFCPPTSICYKSYSNASFLYTISKIFHKNCKLYLHFPYQNSSIGI